MKEKPGTDIQTSVDENDILCRRSDVDAALMRSLDRYVAQEGKTLQELIEILREECAKIPLFAPIAHAPTVEELKQKIE